MADVTIAVKVDSADATEAREAIASHLENIGILAEVDYQGEGF